MISDHHCRYYLIFSFLKKKNNNPWTSQFLVTSLCFLSVITLPNPTHFFLDNKTPALVSPLPSIALGMWSKTELSFLSLGCSLESLGDLSIQMLGLCSQRFWFSWSTWLKPFWNRFFMTCSWKHSSRHKISKVTTEFIIPVWYGSKCLQNSYFPLMLLRWLGANTFFSSIKNTSRLFCFINAAHSFLVSQVVCGLVSWCCPH